MIRRVTQLLMVVVLSLSVVAGRTTADETLQPSDLFNGFPAVKFGMNFADAKTAIAATSATPLGSDTKQTELTWDGKFSGMNGRATLLFKEGVGLWEIAVVVTAMDKRQAVFDAWTKKISEKLGTPAHAESMDHIENKWDLKDAVELELRLIKDDESPVVDIHWVKN